MMEQRERDNPITPIPETEEWRVNKWEHSLTYQTTGGDRKEMALVHSINGSEPKVTFATFAPGQEEPGILVEMSVEETRLRLEFLERLKQAGLLDLS